MSGTLRGAIAWGVVLAGLMVLSTIATGVVAATTTYSVTFTEVGVPSGTAWSVTFNGVTYTPTKASVTITGVSSGSYYWYFSTVAGGTGVQYATTGTTAAYMSVPAQTSQVLVFQKQFSIVFGVTPYGTGYTTPTYTTWENAGATIPIYASHYTGYSFQKWTLSTGVGSVASAKSGFTLFTVKGSGTVTASMKTLTSTGAFTEVGLPSGTSWTVNFNGAPYASTSTSLSVGAQPRGSYGWSIPNVATSTGVEYVPSPSYGYLPMPYLNGAEIVFTKYDLVTFAASPSGSGYTYPSSGYLPDGVAYPVASYAGSGYQFSSWSANNSAVTFGNTTRSSTTVVPTGPTTVTAKFASGTLCTTCSATFYEVGLPKGTTWSITIGGVLYSSSTGSLTLTGLTSAFSFSTPNLINSGPGVAYQPQAVSGYFDLPYQTSVTLQFSTVYLVSFAVTGSGNTGPSGSGWYLAGTYPLAAVPYDLWSFKGWSSSAKAVKVGLATAAGTVFTVSGTGTITAKFVSAAQTVEFSEVGLPHGTTWSILFNGVTYYSSGATLNVTGTAAATYVGWSVYSPISTSNAGVQWAAWVYYGYLYPGQTPVVGLLFMKQLLVTFAAGGTAGGSVLPSGSTWVTNGTQLSISAVNGTSVSFHGWTTKGGPFTVAQSAWAATTVVVGGPGNVTATFK